MPLTGLPRSSRSRASKAGKACLDREERHLAFAGDENESDDGAGSAEQAVDKSPSKRSALRSGLHRVANLRGGQEAECEQQSHKANDTHGLNASCG